MNLSSLKSNTCNPTSNGFTQELETQGEKKWDSTFDTILQPLLSEDWKLCSCFLQPCYSWYFKMTSVKFWIYLVSQKKKREREKTNRKIQDIKLIWYYDHLYYKDITYILHSSSPASLLLQFKISLGPPFPCNYSTRHSSSNPIALQCHYLLVNRTVNIS